MAQIDEAEVDRDLFAIGPSGLRQSCRHLQSFTIHVDDMGMEMVQRNIGSDKDAPVRVADACSTLHPAGRGRADCGAGLIQMARMSDCAGRPAIRAKALPRRGRSV